MRTDPVEPRRRRWPWLVAGAVVVFGLGAGTVWAALSVLTPAQDPLEAVSYTFVEVAPGEVKASMNVTTVAEWSSVPVGSNRAAGVVTGVAVSPGDEVKQGQKLYEVGLRPVVVAQGKVPAFRDIGENTKGADVAQLQRMLVDLGYLGRGAADGTARPSTVAAIKAWQKHLGVERSGVVSAGDVVFVPTLPTRVSLVAEVVHRGATLAGGEDAVNGLSASPVFRIPVTEQQAGLLTAGVRVQISSPEGDTWEGHAGDQSTDQNGAITVTVTGSDGATICGDGCGQIPVTGQVSLAATIITVEPERGLVVPSAALVTGADGQVAVIGEDGTRLPVTVGTSAKGMSIVSGVDAGTRVRVPATGSGKR